MTHIWQGVRSGRWLTAARARGYSLILLGIRIIAFAGRIAVSDGLIDRYGKPLGTDFSNVYAAGTLTRQGRPGQAYQPALQLLNRRPWLAGILIGGLAYKPQFGVLIPLALLASGNGAPLPRRRPRWALATASLLQHLTCYMLDYDLVVLAIAIAFFVRDGLRRGFGSFEISVLAAACAAAVARHRRIDRHPVWPAGDAGA